MANKKINQLVSKTAILSTDIFGIGDATTGQLFKKTIAELQAAIGGAVISVNGLVGTVVLDTDDIQELATPTNKYFTDARARGAISLTVTGNSGASTYSSGTGVLNVPTYTLAGLGGITATFLSGTSGISYNSSTGVISYSGTVYTDASIRALFSGATGITYNSSTGAISYSGTVYTDASVRALISLTTTGTSGASTYNNTTGVINVPNYTLAGLGGISLTSLSGGTGITYNNTTGAISYSGTVYTDASVRALISASGNISYNSTTGVISTSLTQYTDALARASISITTTGTSGASTYNSTTGVINIPQYQGAITLTTTGTSGAATFSSNTLNIPQYQAVLTNPVTGTGTTNFVTKWTSSSAHGNSIIYDNSTGIGINTSSPFGSSAERTIHLTDASGGFATIYVTNAANTVKTILGMQSSNALGSVGTQSNNSFIIITNDTERMRITSAGLVGIGVNPTQSAALTFADALGQKILFNNNVNNYRIDLASAVGGGDAMMKFISGSSTAGEIGFYTTTNLRMLINSAGNLLLGATTSDSYSGYSVMQVGGTTNGLFQTFDGTVKTAIVSNSTLTGLVGTRSNHPLLIISNDLERMRITAGGNILLGTATDNGERLYVSGAIRATSTITANSDIRIKSNITKIENALEKVGQISGYTYNTIYDDKRHGGVIAQEIDKVFPEIVNTGNDGLMGVEYGNISALLIEAIKEQNTKIKNLETLLASK